MKKLIGDTYNFREQIKSSGGKWDSTQKCWFVPDDKYDALQKLVGAIDDGLKLNTQLWEECEICGQEPIYLEVGVCAACARKGRRR
jgi:hypothetical protein